MHDENENFDVSVVLNLFKRPENLETQLLAIESQTLKPKEILLYQDGTSDTIKIPERLKPRFNIIEISPINLGVWARFKFSMNKAKRNMCAYLTMIQFLEIDGLKTAIEKCSRKKVFTEQEG
jgi:glycosyltransferase involved in cell wall biosynthesis